MTITVKKHMMLNTYELDKLKNKYYWEFSKMDLFTLVLAQLNNPLEADCYEIIDEQLKIYRDIVKSHKQNTK